MAKLGEITEISTGLAHKRYESEEGNHYKILTLRSISDMQINPNELNTFISKEEINKKYLTKENDVVLGLFPPYNATRITKKTENIIVPQIFAIIRATKINPEYLGYYLNSERAQHEIQKRSSGTTIEKISIKKLKEIPVEEIEFDDETEFLELMNILNKRITLKTKELELMKKVRDYYLNGGE